MSLFGRRTKKARTQKAPFSVWVHIGFGALTIVLVCVVAVAVWYVTRLERFTIDEVLISGGETIDHEVILDRVESSLNGSYALLIPKRFSFLYPRTEITENLAAYPRLYDLQVYRQGTQLHVSFSEYVPYALWCNDREECVFTNEQGYAFLTAPPLRGAVFVRYLRADAEPRVGENALESTLWEYANTFIDLLKTERQFSVHTVQVTTDNDLHFVLQKGGSLIVAPTTEVEDTFANLVSILDSTEFQHVEPGNFNYIDLRFGNKIYVNEEFPEPELEEQKTASATEEAV